jgi:membrane protein YqaA with SNARE-associated domain
VRSKPQAPLSNFFHHLLRFLFHLHYFGPFVMGVMDSSFLFLPFGNDLLVVGLVARNHGGWPLYVLSAVCGSTLGVFLLDLVARKGGEAGVQKVAGPKRFEYLRKKIGEHGGAVVALGCIAPPPFPFTMVIAVNSALGYPRRRLLWTVAGARAVRFTILSLLAIQFGRTILRIANSEGFKWTMIVFTMLCIVGSVFSIVKWVRRGGKKGRAEEPVAWRSGK